MEPCEDCGCMFSSNGIGSKLFVINDNNTEIVLCPICFTDENVMCLNVHNEDRRFYAFINIRIVQLLAVKVAFGATLGVSPTDITLSIDGREYDDLSIQLIDMGVTRASNILLTVRDNEN